MADDRMSDRRLPPAWLKSAIDGGPAVPWLATLVITHDFRLATWVLVVGSAVALLTSLVVYRRIAPIPAVSGGLALLFGAASLLFHRNDIIQMKMTIVDGVLGTALFIGLALGKNPLKALLGGAFDLADSAWRALTIRYALFWWACAIANEIVRRTQTAHDWGLFRVAVMIAALVFALAQTPFLLKHNRSMKTPEPDPSGK